MDELFLCVFGWPSSWASCWGGKEVWMPGTGAWLHLQERECSWGFGRCRASCCTGRAVCLRAAPGGLHTVGISTSVLHRGTEVLIKGRWAMVWGHQSLSYLSKCSMFSVCGGLCGQSHGSLDPRGRHLAGNYLADAEARHHLGPTVIQMDS